MSEKLSNVEIFAFMVIEEFLMKKNLNMTLHSFRKECGHISNSNEGMISWFDIAVKLRLNEINADNLDNSVLTNLIEELLSQSSIQSRRNPEVISSTIVVPNITTSLPKLQPLKQTTTVIEPAKSPRAATDTETNEDNIRPSQMKKRELMEGSQQLQQSSQQYQQQQQHQPVVLIKRQYDKETYQYQNKNKPSTENWIPVDARLRLFNRDLNIAKNNLSDIRLRDERSANDAKKYSTTELDRAHTDATLGRSKKTPCACCNQMFLPVNLPQCVSQKAIIDIRKMWSKDTVSSFTLFSPELRKGLIRNYDQVRVCYFCAQFFQLQDEYRPSFQDIQAEERSTKRLEAERRENEYWDPLKMCEKDRERQEAEQAALAKQSQLLSPSNTVT